MSVSFENWSNRQKILIILAHPDDPDFFMGATIALWAELGHEIHYVLLTRGDKGSQDRLMTPHLLCQIREEEQKKAAEALGVKSVSFLDYQDGCLEPGLEMRRVVTRIIRQHKPDILVTSDPLNYFPRENAINHPDHRIAGQIVVDALYPAAGNGFYFPELLNEGLEPHSPKELWLSATAQSNLVLNITDTWEKKLLGLHEHSSQIGEIAKFDERMRRRANLGTPEAPRFEESFRRFVFA
jgi:LmbE family N-acetylglucosaminyl deacetylase